METQQTPLRFKLIAGSLVSAGIVVLVLLSFRGAAHQPIGEGLVALARDPWGLATLADLALGLGFVAVWMATVESRPRLLWLWFPLLALLGNIATGIFLLARLRHTSTLQTWLTERR